MDDLFEKLKPLEEFDAKLDIDPFAMPSSDIPRKSNPNMPALERMVELGEEHHREIAALKCEIAALHKKVDELRQRTALRAVVSVILGALMGFGLMFLATMLGWF